MHLLRLKVWDYLPSAGGATLVFDTELIAINGVTKDPAAGAQELR
jgi:hypothetical protein